MHPRIFHEFERVTSTGDGESVFDFLGGSIKAAYKAGWHASEKGKELKPGYPGANEWYVDWIASLIAAYNGRESFQVVELGAGYAQWLVSSIQAYKSLNPHGKAFGLALEADQVHYNWMLQHVGCNLDAFTGVETDLLLAAAGSDGNVSFPILDDPAKSYGASALSETVSAGESGYVTVESLSLKSIYHRLNGRDVDLLHVDVQGAEVELLIEADVSAELASTKAVMIGTHISDSVHQQVRDVVLSAGFKVIIDWPRNSTVRFVGADINTNDGAIFAVNPSHIDNEAVRQLISLPE